MFEMIELTEAEIELVSGGTGSTTPATRNVNVGVNVAIVTQTAVAIGGVTAVAFNIAGVAQRNGGTGGAGGGT